MSLPDFAINSEYRKALLEPFKDERAPWEILLKAIHESKEGLSYEALGKLVPKKDLDYGLYLLRKEHLVSMNRQKRYVINPKEKDTLPLR